VIFDVSSFLPPTIQCLVGDDVGCIEVVLCRLCAVGRGHIIDQAFVERPGVHPALPIVDDGVAEAESLGLHVRNARGDPCRTRAAKIVLGRLGEEGVDCELERARGVERVAVGRLRDIGVNLEHILRRGIGESG